MAVLLSNHAPVKPAFVHHPALTARRRTSRSSRSQRNRTKRLKKSNFLCSIKRRTLLLPTLQRRRTSSSVASWRIDSLFQKGHLRSPNIVWTLQIRQTKKYRRYSTKTLSTRSRSQHNTRWQNRNSPQKKMNLWKMSLFMTLIINHFKRNRWRSKISTCQKWLHQMTSCPTRITLTIQKTLIL